MIRLVRLLGVGTGAAHTQSAPRWSAWAAALLLCCFALMVSDLAWRDMWYDEVGDYLIAAEPLPNVLAATKSGSLDPPLFYYLLHFWSVVAGQSEVALRYPSVLLATLGVALTYSWARRWSGHATGWLAALLLGAMPPVVYYTQEVNQYAGLTFFSSLATWVVAQIELDDRRKWWAGLLMAVVSAAGLSWHYGFLWCWLSLNLIVVFRGPGRAFLLRWGACQLIVLIVGAALFLTVQRAQGAVDSAPVYLLHAYPAGNSLRSLAAFFGTAWLNILVFFSGGYYARSMLPIFGGVGLQIGGLVAGGLARLRSGRLEGQSVVGVASLGATLMTANLFGLYPFWGGRHIMMLAPLIAASLAWAWSALPRPLAGAGILLTLISYALGWPHSWANGFTHGEYVKDLLSHLEETRDPDDGLYVYAESIQTLRYYHRESLPRTRFGRWWAYNHLVDLMGEVEAAIAESPRTWLAFSRCLNIGGACDRLYESISERFCELSRWEKGESRLFLVQPCPQGPASTGP